MLPKIPIFDLTKGMFTAADQQDFDPKAGFADLIENYYLDRPGKIRKRDTLLNLETNLSDKLIKGYFIFVDENLTGNVEYIVYVSKSATDKILVSADGITYAEKVAGLTEIATGKLDTTVVAGKLRLAFGYTSHRWHGYNDINDFFQDQYQPASAWAWSTRQPSYPSTFTYSSLVLTSYVHGQSIIENGEQLYYKVVPVFDGVQEALFGTGRLVYDASKLPTAGNYGLLMLKMVFDSADWNKRITHLNIYRYHTSDLGSVDDALYQRVDTLSTANDDSLTTITDADTMEKKMYDPDASWGVNDYIFVGTGSILIPDSGDVKYVFVHEAIEFDITSNTATMLILRTGMGAAVVGEAYTIEKRTAVNEGNWNSATEQTMVTGTKIWGGSFAWYSATASLSENEIKYQIIQYEASKHGIIVGNCDKAIAIAWSGDTTDPADNTGVTIKYAPYIYYKSGTTYTLHWADYGRLNKGAHPLAGVTSITSAPKYSVFWKGRLFGLNTRVTKADATTEDFPDALVYTEVNQIDIWPADFQLQPPTDQGGIGQGIEVIEEIETLVLFYRNNIEFLKVPLADPDSWRMWSSTAGLGLVNPDAKVKTPIGIFFCSDEGIYLIDRSGRISERPVSFPIDDTYESAVTTGVAEFSAIYYPQQRQVWFNLAAAKTTSWVLDIDSIRGGVIPRWTTYTWASSRKVHLSVLDHFNRLHLYNYGIAGAASINVIGNLFTGDEVPGTTFRTAYMALGSMQRLHLIRRAIIGHKGTRTVTPTVYLNDGASSEAKTAIAASANGEHKKVKIKRYARNFALQLVTNAGTSTNHEISGIEIEVGDE